MKRYFKHIMFIATVCAVVYACGSKDFDEDSQRNNIEKYLTGQRAEYTVHSGAYRHIYYTKDSPVELVTGDSAYLYLTGYVFKGGLNRLFVTNIEEDAASVDMDPTILDFNPRKVRLGDGSLVSGLELALPGSRLGDSLMVYMASDLAYGDRAIGVIPEGSSIAFRVVVDKIVK